MSGVKVFYGMMMVFAVFMAGISGFVGWESWRQHEVKMMVRKYLKEKYPGYTFKLGRITQDYDSFFDDDYTVYASTIYKNNKITFFLTIYYNSKDVSDMFAKSIKEMVHHQLNEYLNRVLQKVAPTAEAEIGDLYPRPEGYLGEEIDENILRLDRTKRPELRVTIRWKEQELVTKEEFVRRCVEVSQLLSKEYQIDIYSFHFAVHGLDRYDLENLTPAQLSVLSQAELMKKVRQRS